MATFACGLKPSNFLKNRRTPLPIAPQTQHNITMNTDIGHKNVMLKLLQMLLSPKRGERKILFHEWA